MAAPQVHIKKSGAWKGLASSTGAYVKVGSVWKTVSKIHVKVSGAWKLAYQAIEYTLKLPTSTWENHNERLAGTGYCATGFECLTTGRFRKITGSGGTSNVTDCWIHETAIGEITGSDYEAQLSGVSTSGLTIERDFPAYSVYYDLGSPRYHDLSRTSAGLGTGSGTLTIREVANTSNSVSMTYSLQAQLTL